MMDFTDAESRTIGLMLKASTTLPDDMWAVAAVQNLACLFVKIESLLCDADKAMLIGIGGFIAHQGKAEMEAVIHASMAISRARSAKP